MRDFAEIFPALQDLRHLADYDPFVTFDTEEVAQVIQQAEDAIAAFDRVPEAEKSGVLALMMVRGRD